MADSPSPPRRILLIRPSALGDVCRTVPVLVSLKRAFPQARIDWLVQDTFAAAIEAHPDLGGIVPFVRQRFARWWYPPVGAELLSWLRDLGRARYDLVLDCQGLARSAIFARATSAPRRLGYSQAAEGGWIGLTERVSAPLTMHTVDRMLALARAAGAERVADMRLYVPPADRAAVGADPPFAVIAPTSRWPGKRWPADRFAVVAQRLLADSRLGIERVVLVGADHERDQCGPLLDLVSRDKRVIDRIGDTSIGGLMALIERSRLVIANDSAALHMAVGFDRPLIGLFGPTHVDRVGPYRRDADVIQKVTPADRLDHKDPAIGRSLMERITVEDVVARLDALARAPRRATAAAIG